MGEETERACGRNLGGPLGRNEVFFTDAVARAWRNVRVRFGLSLGTPDLGAVGGFPKARPGHLTTAPAVSGCPKPTREPDRKPGPGDWIQELPTFNSHTGSFALPAAFLHLYYQRMPASPMEPNVFGVANE